MCPTNQYATLTCLIHQLAQEPRADAATLELRRQAQPTDLLTQKAPVAGVGRQGVGPRAATSYTLEYTPD